MTTARSIGTPIVCSLDFWITLTMSPQTVVPKIEKAVTTINAVAATFLKCCDIMALGLILMVRFP